MRCNESSLDCTCILIVTREIDLVDHGRKNNNNNKYKRSLKFVYHVIKRCDEILRLGGTDVIYNAHRREKKRKRNKIPKNWLLLTLLE